MVFNRYKICLIFGIVRLILYFYNMEEIWKTIEDNPNYEVSNMGNVRSVDRFVNCNGGVAFRKGKTLKKYLSKRGYYVVNLPMKQYKVHRLVAEAFIPNPDNKPQIDHISTIKTDNTVCLNEDGSVNYDGTNLRWVTNKENMNNPITRQNCSKNNYYKGKMGSKHHNSIPIYQLTKEGEIIKKWECAATVAKELNISRIGIRRCCQGKAFTAGGYAWKNVSDYERAS